MKAAGRSALAGGLILAAIEGLNLVLTRVLMPSMEQQAAEQGVPIDPLLPPADPTRPRINRHRGQQQKINWDSAPAPSPLFPGFGGGLGGGAGEPPALPSSNWEPQGFSIDSFGSSSGSSSSFDSTSSSSSTPPEDSGASKSSWKFW